MYYNEFIKIINNKEGNKLLLHSCCAVCSSHVITYLFDYFDITILFYNPNIEPINEYNKRKKEQIRLCKILDVKYIDCDYDNDIFKKSVVGFEEEVEGGKRCNICFYLRLSKTASLAKGYDYFGTTLTVSPHKNSQIINEVGLNLEKKFNVKFLVADFKKKEGYKNSVLLANKYDLYRQDYCGCSYANNN